MGFEACHVPVYNRSKEQRYKLQGRAQLSPEEMAFLLRGGVSVSKLLEYTREQLESLYPELQEPEPALPWPELLELVAAK